MIDSFSKFGGTHPLKKISQTKINEISKIPTTSKQVPIEIESDRVKEIYDNIFQKLLKLRKLQPSVADVFNEILRNLVTKRVFLQVNDDWITEHPSVIKKNNNTSLSSSKKTPIQASLKRTKN